MWMLVADLMTRPAVTCLASDSLEEAARRMHDHDCGALPVLDEHGGLAGMITDRDACMAAYLTGRALAAIAVWEAMARAVIRIGPSDRVVDAEAAMTRHQVRRLPVIDHDNRVVGVLSLGDLARQAGYEQTHRLRLAEGVTTRGVVGTMAAVSRPRRPSGRLS